MSNLYEGLSSDGEDDVLDQLDKIKIAFKKERKKSKGKKSKGRHQSPRNVQQQPPPLVIQTKDVVDRNPLVKSLAESKRRQGVLSPRSVSGNMHQKMGMIGAALETLSANSPSQHGAMSPAYARGKSDALSRSNFYEDSKTNMFSMNTNTPLNASNQALLDSRFFE